MCVTIILTRHTKKPKSIRECWKPGSMFTITNNDEDCEMKQVKDMPQEGQFVGVWEYKGNIWSNTYKWIDGILCVSDEKGNFGYDDTKFGGFEITWFVVDTKDSE